MNRGVVRTSWWARGLMLLGALLLFAAPMMSAAATMPKDDCCAEAPCHHDHGQAPPCPDACVMACQALASPETLIVGPAEIGAGPIAPMTSRLPPGRAPAPELPPPR